MEKSTMTDVSTPVSIRLAPEDIDRLSERAKRISGTKTGVARELIRSGLSDGDPFEQASRLLKIERKLAIVTQDIHLSKTSQSELRATVARIEKMFEQLLLALSGQLKAERN
jgi:predicted DNA-binding protein